MPVEVPSTKPRLSSAELLEKLAPFNLDLNKHKVIVVGIRGYYSKLGASKKNERGIYDDALFIYTPTTFASFNANTDPSYMRKKTAKKKGMATLKAGAWFVHIFDKHKGQYLALCQRRGNVTVIRDGTPDTEDTGSFGINIHRGGYNGTSSEGCQTIHPSQWDSFISTAIDQAKRFYTTKWNTTVIPYILLNEG